MTDKTPVLEKLIFTCSGAANVGEIGDRAARELTREGLGKMFCLAALSACQDPALERTRKAGKIVAIDGCEKDCAKTCLAAAGFTFTHVRVTDRGMQKGKSPATAENIEKIRIAAAGLLS